MGDLISREELAHEMRKAICGADSGLCVSTPDHCLQQCMVPIYAAPTVKPEVRHGRWIEGCYQTKSKRNRIIHCKKYTCPFCGTSSGRVKRNYCHNCGAKMDGGAT